MNKQNKIIHYCWFGKKPLPKKFKKYIKSWKKFLPNYKIIEWNEKNFDIKITNFSKEAYKQKKWAFVSDVARFYALKKYGGIYFDTDVEIVSNINFLLEKYMWVGREDDNYIGTAIIAIKHKESKEATDIMNIYKKTKFDIDNIYKITSPQILTSYLKKSGLKPGDFNQKIKNKIFVYKKEYFYPKTYMRNNDIYTNNTCLIHHFDASWTSLEEKISIFFVRKKMGFLVKYINKIFSYFKKLKTIF